ncbi:initiator tRNA phosphoribosyl transferase [Lactarius akahatsu]|uniref:Initiator tRNA phosphoribosyl transferase n=1 Tax=Lactarius akahatsu TaxID=416441 RepID=A0AAD4QG83_9AGAM|nr:initiator tRNA phosphoribosyl transferase [Lactarius akahatsu]
MSALAYIRRESLDIYNRIQSIGADIAFVNQVRAAYPALPLIPNLRCGAWYTDPSIADPGTHAYFKSTDGHHGNWSFNLRRPNLHLLPVAAAHGGIILVDSTRAGKRLPDALSKTVPIWCAVVNRAMRLRRGELDAASDSKEAPTAWLWDGDLRTPPGIVGAHEHAQIAAQLDGWAASLADSSYALPTLDRPLRPLWVTPASSRFPHIAPDAAFLPVICVSASCAIDAVDGRSSEGVGLVGLGRRAGGFSYVQGSGDDHELWGQGLTPAVFWQNRAELLACPRAQLETLVAQLVAEMPRDTVPSHGGADGGGPPGAWRSTPVPVTKVGGRVLLCSLADLPRDLQAILPGPSGTPEEAAFVIVDDSESDVPPDDTDARCPAPTSSNGADAPSDAAPGDPPSSRVLRVRLPPGKRGQHVFLHEVLPSVTSFASTHLSPGRAICVAGGDAGVGVALVLLQLFFDDAGKPCRAQGDAAPSKNSVRTRLEWVIASRPQTNPSRAILKRVNDFLLSPRSHRGEAEAGATI